MTIGCSEECTPESDANVKLNQVDEVFDMCVGSLTPSSGFFNPFHPWQSGKG